MKDRPTIKIAYFNPPDPRNWETLAGFYEPQIEMILWIANLYSVGGLRGKQPEPIETILALMLAGI